MRPLRELQVVTQETGVSDALIIVANSGADFLPVVENGWLEGIVFRSQLLHAMQGHPEMKLPPAYQRLLYGTSKVLEGNA